MVTQVSLVRRQKLSNHKILPLNVFRVFQCKKTQIQPYTHFNIIIDLPVSMCITAVNTYTISYVLDWFGDSNIGIIMSPPMKWGDILFLAPLSVRPSVRPSVCPSHFRVRSISFEPLVGFTNNFAQMSSMMRRCAVPMFDQGRFKVKVII